MEMHSDASSAFNNNPILNKFPRMKFEMLALAEMLLGLF